MPAKPDLGLRCPGRTGGGRMVAGRLVGAMRYARHRCRPCHHRRGFAVRWSRCLGDGNGAGEPGLIDLVWSDGAEADLDLDLTLLPLAAGGTVDLLPEMAARGHLDLVLEHHTLLDFAFLTQCTGGLDASTVEDEHVPLADAPVLENHPNPFGCAEEIVAGPGRASLRA